ncbi:hypothetical protein [Streptomyces sp. SM8]|jgi:hypothetical protein|uniref:hypothetical protein n=1 Tax=Streptomyces sp. SM8 TaxID=1195457 RepID=UPI0002831133|nr:hypothetical protein [Streptomyces sp. SM8]PKA37941.1 hypothetical protein SM8_029420 [Streptomyces sp. SM8]
MLHCINHGTACTGDPREAHVLHAETTAVDEAATRVEDLAVKLRAALADPASADVADLEASAWRAHFGLKAAGCIT